MATPAAAATRSDGSRSRANRGVTSVRRAGGCTQPRCSPAAKPSAAAPNATSSTAVSVPPPMATSAPWKTPTTTTPTTQLAARPAAVKNSSGRRGAGALSSTSTAARLVPGRRPLNSSQDERFEAHGAAQFTRFAGRRAPGVTATPDAGSLRGAPGSACGIRIGFHASHEQVHPAALRDAAVRAEAAGFDAVMCSDHLAPWSEAQGHSGYTWAWLGAALQATDHVPMGSFHAPGQRYHPVISAQAMATVAAMFPGRFPWVALGSGQALNEHVTGAAWPVKADRMERLRECVDVMRALWAGEEVTHRGHIVVDRARLWSLPGRAAATGRRRDQRGDGALGRRLGRRPHHRQPAAGHAAPHRGRLP